MNSPVEARERRRLDLERGRALPRRELHGRDLGPVHEHLSDSERGEPVLAHERHPRSERPALDPRVARRASVSVRPENDLNLLRLSGS